MAPFPLRALHWLMAPLSLVALLLMTLVVALMALHLTLIAVVSLRALLSIPLFCPVVGFIARRAIGLVIQAESVALLIILGRCLLRILMTVMLAACIAQLMAEVLLAALLNLRRVIVLGLTRLGLL